MKKIVFLICIIHCLQGLAQYRNAIFDKVIKYPNHFNNVKDFSYRIQNDFEKQEDQVQAVYTWIATNIKYDIDNYYSFRGSRVIYFRSNKERKQEINKLKENLVITTLKSKKGICEGYAHLLQAVCHELEIPAVIINGSTKLDAKLINTNPGYKNHSWNAVYYDNSWHLIDATWAAGYEVEGNRKWVFSFNEHYFDQNPSQFIKHHFPQDQKWQLLDPPVSRAKFFADPIFYQAYFDSNIKLSEKQSGSIIKNNSSKYITIVFDKLPKNKNDFLTITRTSKFPQKIRFKKNSDGSFTGKIKVTTYSDFLTIYYRNKAILDFKIILEY